MLYKRVADQKLEIASRKIAGVTCAVVLVHVAMVFAGWIMGDSWLIHFPVSPQYGTPMPLTALSLLLCTISLWLLTPEERVTRASRAFAMAFALGAMLLGGLIIWEYAYSGSFGLDLLLFPRTVSRLIETLPGRPAFATAVCTVLLGLALVCLDVKSKFARIVLEVALLLVVLISLERCVSFLYREIGLWAPRWRLFGRPVFQPMSPITSLTYIALAIGILYTRLHRREGWLALFYTRGPQQLMARWMVPLAIFAPILFGWLGMLAFRAGLRGTVYPMSLVVSGMIVLLLTVILLGARAMRRADAQRVITEAALAERERLQHAVLENAGAGILVMDVEGHAVTTNRTLQNMLGYDAAELRELPFWSLTHANELAQNRRLFRELVWGQRHKYFIETRCTRKDGTVFWVHINTSVVRDPSGQTELVIAMLQDVTEHKEAEEAQRRLIDIIEATPDFVGIADVENKVVYLNRAGRNLTGFHGDEVADLTIDDFHPPDAARFMREEAIPTAMSEGVWAGETQLTTRSGEVIPVSQVVLAHKRHNGHVVYLSTVMRDITHRKRLELAQQFLLEVSRASSGSMDIDTILRSLVSLVVPRHADYCAMYLMAPQGNLEKAAFARAPANGEGDVAHLLRVYGTNKKANPMIAEVARSGEPLIVPRVSDADLARLVRGGRHHLLLRKLGLRSIMALPLRGRERVLGVICYMRTATDKPFEGHRVALAREMAERVALALDNADLLKRAREATRIRDEVLRVVAHDLRNPLNTISLTSDFLHEKLAGPHSESWLSKLDIIIRSVAQANRLIEDLLDVARMETGTLSIEPIPTSVRQLVSDVVQTHQPLAEAKRISLRASVGADAAIVLADPARVVQVFSNLIGNAIKFCPEETEIVLEAAQHNGRVRFSIRDQGKGIAEPDQEHLFDPFWQARKGKGGVGLGLPIAKAIVQAHGGRMWLDSKLGRGSTFFFTLPLAREEMMHQAAAD
jgi:PAS domain S-box-containing protein